MVIKLIPHHTPTACVQPSVPEKKSTYQAFAPAGVVSIVAVAVVDVVAAVVGSWLLLVSDCSCCC